MLNITKRLLFKQKNSKINNIVSRSFVAKIYNNADEAIADIRHGSTIAFGGFGLVGLPENLISALGQKGHHGFDLRFKRSRS